MMRMQHGRLGVLLGRLFVLVLVVAACSGGAGGAGGAGTSSASPSAVPSPAGPPHGIGGRATAGPVCPVERVPPDPSCAARPVAGAVVVIQDAAGTEVARATTDADGQYFVSLPAGSYAVVPQPAKGLMRAPSPQPATVAGGITTVDLSYDTGIR